MPVLFKTKCSRCKKNWVTVSRRDRYCLCFECQRPELEKEIKDPEMKKFFDIPQEFYQRNMFLRNIKSSYLKFGSLTQPQKDAFMKTVEKFREEAKE